MRPRESKQLHQVNTGRQEQISGLLSLPEARFYLHSMFSACAPWLSLYRVESGREQAPVSARGPPDALGAFRKQMCVQSLLMNASAPGSGQARNYSPISQ